MAKSNSFFGTRRGSTKSHTYTHSHGWQITKDRQEAPTNPRTVAQMLQRMRVRMIQNAASQLRPLISQSFEGVRQGDDSVREFLRLNQRKNAITPTVWVEKDSESLGIANYIVSDGSLSTLHFKDWNTNIPALINDNLYYYNGKGFPTGWDDDNGFQTVFRLMGGLSENAKLIFIGLLADNQENAAKGAATNVLIIDLLNTNEDFIFTSLANYYYYNSDLYNLSIGLEMDLNDIYNPVVIDMTIEPYHPNTSKFTQMAAFFCDKIGNKTYIQGTRLTTSGGFTPNDPLKVMQSYLI